MSKVVKIEKVVYGGYGISLSIDKHSIYTHLYLGLRDYGYNMDL